MERVEVLHNDGLDQLGVDCDEGREDPVVAAVGLAKSVVLLCVKVLADLKTLNETLPN